MINIAKDNTANNGVKLYGTKVNNLRYADDIVGVLTQSANALGCKSTPIKPKP